MHVTLLALGTKGDVQPDVARGIWLRDAGHWVRIAAYANFRSFVESRELELECPSVSLARFCLRDSKYAKAAIFKSLKADASKRDLLPAFCFKRGTLALQRDNLQTLLGRWYRLVKRNCS